MVAGASLALVLSACNGVDDEPDPEPDVDVDPDEDPPDDADPDEEADPDEDAAEDPDDEAVGDPDDEAVGDPDDEAVGDPDDDVAMLDGDPSTETAEADGEIGTLAVTDVRVGTHDGFDRVVFELEGDALAGWHVRYDDEPTQQGSGEPIEYEGDTALAVAIHNATLPPDLPEEIEHWDDTIAGPEGGAVTEVISDTIFEGIHTFVIGTTGEHPFLIERLEDPQRVVIDIVH